MEDGGEGHERKKLIFMWPVPSRGGRLGDDGCEREVGWKEGERERHKETEISELVCVSVFVWARCMGIRYSQHSQYFFSHVLLKRYIMVRNEKQNKTMKQVI